MPGTVTVTEKIHGSVKKIRWSWLSDGSGNADKITTLPHDGVVIGLQTNPGAAAPTDNYDITITDDDGDDILGGAGQNRDTVDTETVMSSGICGVAASKLTLNVSNAGASKDGVVILWYR